MSKSKLVDQIGTLKAMIAPLAEKVAALQAKLAAKGDGSYEGDMFDASVSTHDCNKLDMEAVRAKLTPQFIAANTTPYTKTVVKVVAKKKKGG